MIEKEKSNAPEVTTTSHIIKMKSLGISNEKIGAKFGMTPEQVQKKIKEITDAAELLSVSGAAEFIQVMHLAVQQYQLLGTTMGLLVGAINNLASPDDLRKVLGEQLTSDDIDKLLPLLNKHFMVLNPFVLPDVKKLLDSTKKILDN